MKGRGENILMSRNRKGISAVITAVLLLLLAIGIFLVVKGWQSEFVSDLTVDVQKESARTDINSKIEAIEEENLYFNNAVSGQRSILEISIDDNTCNIEDLELSKGMNILNVSSCVNGLSQGIHNVLIVTEDKTFSKTIYIKGDGSVESGANVDSNLGHLVFQWKKNNVDLFYQEGSVVIGSEDPRDSKLRVVGKISSSDDICVEGGNCLNEFGDPLWEKNGDDIEYKKGGVKIEI